MEFTVCFGDQTVVALGPDQWQYLSWYLSALASDNSLGTCINAQCTCGRERSANFTDAVSRDVHIFLFGLPNGQVSETHLLATTRALLFLCAGDHVLQSIQQLIIRQWDNLPIISKAIAYTALCQLKRSAFFCNNIDWFARAVRSDEDMFTGLHNDPHLTTQEKIEFIAFYFVDCAVLLPVDKWWPGARTTAQVHKELQARIPNFNIFQRTPCWAIGEFVAMAAIGLVTAAPTCLYTTKNLIDEALLPIFTDMAAQGFHFGQRSSNVIIAAREEVVITFTMTNSPGISSLVHSLPVDAVQTVWCPAIGVMASPRCLLAWRSRVCSGTASETLLRLQEIGFETASDHVTDRDSALAPRSLRCRGRSDFEIRREFRLLMNAEPTPVACLRFSKYSKTDGVAPWHCLDVAEYGRGFYCYHMHFPWASTASAGLYPIYPINHAMYFELGPVRVESRQHQLSFIPTEEMFNLLCNLVAHIPIIRGGEAIEVSTYFSMAAGLTPPRGMGFLTLRPLSLQRLTNAPIALRWECVHCSF